MKLNCIVLLLGGLTVGLGLGQNTDLLKRENIDTTAILVKPKRPGLAADDFHRGRKAKVKKLKHLRWEIVQDPAPGDFAAYQASGLFVASRSYVYTPVAVPNDPLFNQQWCHQVMESAAAWDLRTSNDVVVAVIDTGINYSHPDLAGNLWTGPNGEHGFSAFGGVLTVGGQDDHFHGSHCAGIIGAIGNNALGVAGVNWRLKLISFKFLSASGSGSTGDGVICIDKMIDLKRSGVNIRVSNNSWGAPGYDLALEDAFREAENAGILNICAAGNNGQDTDEQDFTPSTLKVDGIVSVLASDSRDQKAIFSNFGIETTDIFAPGVNILSTVLGTGFQAASGTSMASPQVAGAAAMLFALNPSLTPAQAKSVLLHPDSYDRVSFAENTTGGGRLNLRKLWNNPAINNPPPPNQAPSITASPDTNVIFTPGTMAVTGSDPDGDPLFYRSTWKLEYPWIIWHGLGQPPLSYSAATNSVSVNGSSWALDQARNIRMTVSDGRGGSAAHNAVAWTTRNESLVRDLGRLVTGWKVWLVDGRVWFRLDVSGDTSGVRYEVVAMPQLQFGSPCCFNPNQDYQAVNTAPAPPGSYSVRAHLFDSSGNFATGPWTSLIVSSTTKPPEARITYNTRRGPAPLQVVADMRGTALGDVQRPYYTAMPWQQGGFSTDIANPVRTFTLETPGVHWIEFTVFDAVYPLQDRIVEYFTVLPVSGIGTNEPPLPPPPPTPDLTAPQNLVASYSSGTMNVRWVETAASEDRVELWVQSKLKGPWGDWRLQAMLPADSATYSFTPARGQFQFRAKVCKSDLCSVWSNTSSSVRVR